MQAEAMLITTGTDVAQETRAFNDDLAERLKKIPSHHEVDDPPAIRAARARGEGPFPAPVRLPEGQERVVTGRGGRIPLRVFVPPTVRGALLHIHGGGWTLGSAAAQDPMLWWTAQAAELAVLSVDYRLAPENPYPAAPDDCEDVARWLIVNARSEFGTDRLVLSGESAGAHLAAVTLLRLGDQRTAFRGVHFNYGIFDLSMSPSQRLWGDLDLVLSTPIIRWFIDQFLPDTGVEERRAPDISPLYADLKGMPPARFAVGTRDLLLDDSLFMADRWRAAGGEASLEVIAEAAHGYLGLPITVAERELARQAEFLTAAIA
jgi:acetyl esterase/lipase